MIIWSDLGLANTAPDKAPTHNIGRHFEDLSAINDFTENDDYFSLAEIHDNG